MCNEFSAVTYFHKALITSAVFFSGTRQTYRAKSGTLFCHGDESTFCRHHLSCSTSTRLSVFNTAPVSDCPPTHTRTHKHSQRHMRVCVQLDICAHMKTSNATKNNLAIHHAPLFPSSCHPDWQPRSRVMRQQNKAPVDAHYSNNPL